MHLSLQPERVLRRAGENFIWIRRNPLRSPDSAKEKQGNASLGGERGAYGTENHFLITASTLHLLQPTQFASSYHSMLLANISIRDNQSRCINDSVGKDFFRQGSSILQVIIQGTR
jgi:hypothetical protein